MNNSTSKCSVPQNLEGPLFSGFLRQVMITLQLSSANTLRGQGSCSATDLSGNLTALFRKRAWLNQNQIKTLREAKKCPLWTSGTLLAPSKQVNKEHPGYSTTPIMCLDTVQKSNKSKPASGKELRLSFPLSILSRPFLAHSLRILLVFL